MGAEIFIPEASEGIHTSKATRQFRAEPEVNEEGSR
jgi:hypothetical protein